MQKILIYADDFERLEVLQRILEKHLNNPLEICMNEPGLVAQVEARTFSLGIFRAKQLNQKLVTLANRLRKSGFTFPLMMATDKIDTTTIAKAEELTDVHCLIGEPTEKALIGLTRKLLLARRVPRQHFRRFNTNVMAQIEPLATGHPLISCMYNLSQGGAYCEFEANEAVGVGDLIKLQVNLDGSRAGHILNGKVIWTTPKGRFSGRFGIGFKFVSSQDAYRALISKL
jgi:hypothetical protein